VSLPNRSVTFSVLRDGIAKVSASCLPALFLLTLAIGCGGGKGGGGGTTPPPVTPPSNLVYPQTVISASVGTAIQTDTPTVTGTVTAYSVTPALPAGISLNATTGTISGTPTAASAQSSYTVTASNSGGSITASVQITVTSTPPSNLVYPQPFINGSVGVAIQTETPTVTGTVSGFTVSPALPAGLSLDPATGTLSGTPTATAAQANYTVTATNAAGSTATTIQITIQIAPPSNLVYSQPAINATVGTAIDTDTPSFSGAVDSFAISPALPSGLSMDPGTGVISGTPSFTSSKTTYMVTAQNAGGSTSTQITVVVRPVGTVLLDPGQQAKIEQLFTTANRVLSYATDGHWVLWDYASGTALAEGNDQLSSGYSWPAIESGGGIFTLQYLNGGFGIYSLQDGSSLGGAPSGGLWSSVASDGSYVCGPNGPGTGRGFSAYTPAGQQEFTLNGNYVNATVLALPGQIDIANGAAGSDAVEIVTVPGGVDTISAPYAGKFAGWFPDGSKFVTWVNNVFRVYSSNGTQLAETSVPVDAANTYGTPIGQGNWVSVPANTTSGNDILQIYAIGNSTPTETYTLPEYSTYAASGLTLGVFKAGAPGISIIDLSGATPSISQPALPPPTSAPSFFAAASASQWVVGTQNGVLFDGASVSATPRYFGYGAVNGIAIAGNTAAISTAIGKILLYDLTVPQQTSSIDLLANKVELSSDASILGAAEYSIDSTNTLTTALNLYSLPAGTTLQSLPHTGTPELADFSLAASGNSIGQVLAGAINQPSTYTRTVTGISGTPLIWNDTGVEGPIFLSPDGTLIAVSNDPAELSSSVTTIYHNGILVATVPGVAEGWSDNGHLLAATYTQSNATGVVFAGSTIYDPTGAVLATFQATAIPAIANAQFPSSDSVYAPVGDTTYSLTTGLEIWQGPYQGLPDAASDSFVIYGFDSQYVLAATN